MTYTTKEQPFDKAQETLHDAMRVSTDPRWVERQLCNDYADPGPPIIKPSRFGWMIWPAMGIGFAVVIAIASI